MFASETSGFVHVVSVNASRAADSVGVVDLTPQPCDNQAYQLHGAELYVTHNCDTVDSLGIAAVDLATGHRRTIVAGQNHTIADAEAGLLFLKAGTVYIDTTITNSTTLRLIPADGSATRALTPSPIGAGFDASAFVKPQLIQFTSGEFLIHAQLFTPPSSRALPLGTKGPAVIFTHGGCQRQMYAAFHYSGCYAALYTQNQHLASLGFTVLSINYRGGPGYGVNFRTANATGWEGAAEYQDVLAGARWLGAQPNVDAARIGIYGLSYGGLNAMQALTRNSDVFAAGVANAPVFNWITQKRFDGDSQPFELALPRAPGFRTLPTGPRSDLASPRWLAITQKNMELAWQSSPAGHLDQLRSPLLVIQGDSDANVDFAETVGIVNGLRARGFPESDLEMMMVPDERHGLARFANQLEAARRTTDFFVRRLRPHVRVHA
eukprot:COSAG01_NODE_544_length_15682_cov_107.959379_7_plen_436_part_00